MRTTQLATDEINNKSNSSKEELTVHKEQIESNENYVLRDEQIQQIIFSKMKHYKSNEKYKEDITVLELSHIQCDDLSIILRHLALNIKSKYSNITHINLYNSITYDLPNNANIWDAISNSGNVLNINFGINKFNVNDIIFINILKVYYPKIKYTYLPQDLFLPEFLYSIQEFNILLSNIIIDAQTHSFWSDSLISIQKYTDEQKNIILKARLESINKAILMALKYNLPIEIKDEIDSQKMIIDRRDRKMLINKECSSELYKTLQKEFNKQTSKAKALYIIEYTKLSLKKFAEKEFARIDNINNETTKQSVIAKQAEEYKLLYNASSYVNISNSANKRESYDECEINTESDCRKHKKFR